MFSTILVVKNFLELCIMIDLHPAVTKLYSSTSIDLFLLYEF